MDFNTPFVGMMINLVDRKPVKQLRAISDEATTKILIAIPHPITLPIAASMSVIVAAELPIAPHPLNQQYIYWQLSQLRAAARQSAAVIRKYRITKTSSNYSSFRLTFYILKIGN